MEYMDDIETVNNLLECSLKYSFRGMTAVYNRNIFSNCVYYTIKERT